MHGGATRTGRWAATSGPVPGAGPPTGGAARLLAVVPVLGLAALVLVLLVVDPVRSLTGAPPLDSLAVERTVLEPGRIELHVRNDGRNDVGIAQVMVNGAYWQHRATARELGRFDSATISLDYPWIEGVPLHVVLLTRSGTPVEHVLENPTETPDLDGGVVGNLALAGMLMAPIPIALGLAWLPALRRSPPAWLDAAMAFTLGLLAFLLVDSAAAGLEAAAEAPEVVDGVGLFALGALGAIGAVAMMGGAGRSSTADAAAQASVAWRLAWLVALGIGLHNLGEGLAVGASVNRGDVALGTALVLGFAVHNVTEGVAIASPLAASTRSRVLALAGLVAVAGAPVFPGMWLGGFVLPAGWAALALGVAAGAIAQVVWVILLWLHRRGTATSPLVAGAFTAAVAVLYVTGLLAG